MTAIMENLIPSYSTVPSGTWAVAFPIIGVLAILSIIAMWRIFTKAGEAGWKSLIPFYSQYIQYQICWDKAAFIKLVIYSVMSGIGEFFGSGDYGDIVTIIAGIVVIIFGILVIINMIKMSIRLAKSFGKSTGFGIGRYFVPVIFDYILGFGKAKYIGKPA